MQTAYGNIKCSWVKEKDRLVLHIAVPSYTSSNFVVPELKRNPKDLLITESGNKLGESGKFSETGKITMTASTDGPIVLYMKPGNYRFEMNY